MSCDLHTHSVYSDGTYTPSQLIEEAKARGISAVALTDHNTASGVPEFLAAARGGNILAIGGTELSCECTLDRGAQELHVLALFLPESSYRLIDERNKELVERKRNSYFELEERLARDGISIDYAELCKRSVNLPNRAAIAEQLMQRGYIATIKEAFGDLLRSGGKYYLPPHYPSVFETLDFIREIGAVSVLAHPFLNLSEDELLCILPALKEHGLCAMETYYAKYDENTTTRSIKIARDAGILQSGGSDFHGTRKPDISLGIGCGSLSVPDECVRKLMLSRKGNV